MKFTSIFLSTVLIGILLHSTSGFAASVSQVKESKLLLNLEGSSMATGDEFFLVNESGKKVGLAKIKAIKGEKALAELLKGKAAPGMTVQARAAGAGSSSNAAAAEAPPAEPAAAEPSEEASSSTEKKVSSRKKKKNTGGFLLGYAMNNMTLTAQYSTLKNDLTMKDSGFLAKGFYDYSLMKDLVVRFGTGIQMFGVKGTTTNNICENGTTTACEVSFTYLVFEANGNYYLTDGSFKLWLGLGYSFLLAATKKNNVPNLSSDSSTNQMITAGFGADWWTSRSAFIPLSIQYGMFPGSSNVKADALIVQAGYGFTF